MSKPTSGEVLLGMIERGYRPQSPRPTPGPLYLDGPNQYHPHSISILTTGPRGNWIIRCTEEKTGARRGESPTWLGWRKGEKELAALIVAAVNGCFAVNPDNPLAVAEGLPELAGGVAEALHALNQHGDDFHPIIQSHLRAALAKLEAKGIEEKIT